MFAIRNTNRQFYIMYNLYDTLCFVVRWNTRLKQQQIMGYAMCIIRLSYMMANLSSWAAASTTERERATQHISTVPSYILIYVCNIWELWIGPRKHIILTTSHAELLKRDLVRAVLFKMAKDTWGIKLDPRMSTNFFLRHTILFARVDVNWG